MKVSMLIEMLKQFPQDMEVTMADFSPVVAVEQVNYGDGVVVITDEEECEEEE